MYIYRAWLKIRSYALLMTRTSLHSAILKKALAFEGFLYRCGQCVDVT